MARGPFWDELSLKGYGEVGSGRWIVGGGIGCGLKSITKVGDKLG